MVRVPIGPPKRDPRESQVVGTEHSWDAPPQPAEHRAATDALLAAIGRFLKTREPFDAEWKEAARVAENEVLYPDAPWKPLRE
jgi:hypothetical protein